MTASQERTNDRDTSVAAYEALRGCVLSSSAIGGHFGLVLLQREGVTAWRSRGAVCSARVERAKDPDHGAAFSISDEIQAGVIQLLASMALRAPRGREEMRS